MMELVTCHTTGDAPLAVYTHHCAGHRLNLVISHSCSVAEISYMLDHVVTFSWPVTSNLPFLQILYIPDIGKQKPLIDLCKTRWAESVFSFLYIF